MTNHDKADRLIMAAVLVLAAAFAVAMLVDANVKPDALWSQYYHDRNSHFAFGQNLALAVVTGDPAWFFGELLKAQVWPPVHGLVLATILLVGGIDHRLGIVPSLMGWTLAIVLVAAIARQMFRGDRLWIAAGAIATTLAIASPAFRLLASDVMLECLGAALSAAAVWAYGRATAPEAPTAPAILASRWRLLGLILTVLFFEKGNYWGLVVAAIAATHLSAGLAGNRHHWLAVAGALMRRIDVGAALRALIDPLVIAAALVLVAVIYIFARGPTAIELRGHTVSLYPPYNLMTVAYALVFTRFLIAWLRHRPAWNAALGARGRALFYWHVAPVAVSFVLPRRLASFLWFVGPLNARTGFDPLDGIEFYWRSFADGFSATPSIAWLTAALFVAGLWHVRRFPPGGRAVFALALVGIAGVVIHPQHQGRFLTSWIFAAWIGAGAGGAVLLEYLLPRQLWLPVAGAATIMLAVSSWRAAPPAAYTVAIHPTGERPSDLDLIRTVLPDVAGLRSFSYATTFGESALWSWVPQEACRCKVDVERPWIAAASREEARSLMADRLASSQSPIFVIVDAPAWPDQLPEFGLAYDSMSAILDATAAQDRYVREKAYRLPQFAAEISVWRRRASPPHGRPSAVETQPALSEAGWGAAGGAAPVHVDKPYHQAGS